MTNWKERLAPGMPPLRPGEFAMLTGWSPATIRKQMAARGIESVSLIRGGERRVPVGAAREIAIRLAVIAA